MTTVVTYKPNAYCQLKLDSGERLLISCAQTGIKIVKLGLGGLLPTKTIADWPLSEVRTMMRKFVDPANPLQHPLDAIKSRLMQCSSLQEVEKVCSAG